MATEGVGSLKVDRDNTHDQYILHNPTDQESGREDYFMNPTGSVRPSPRRTKRLVPDGEKDIKYWEKRKRNNDAARRSRENKRRLDLDVRQRLHILEEELSLARKELAVIKIKFGLPLDQRFLSIDDSGEFIGTTIVPNELNGQGRNDDTSSYCVSPTRHVPEEPMGGSVPPVHIRPTIHSNPIRQEELPLETQDQRSGARSTGAGAPDPDPEGIPVKKRKKGRKEWEEAAESTDLQSNVAHDFYGRMMPNSPYHGMVWPSPNPSVQQGQFPFPGQIPSMSSTAAAYQALMDDQQRLPSINAFSNVKEEMQHLQHQHTQQLQQQQQQQQQQPQLQPQLQQQQIQPNQQERESPKSRDIYGNNGYHENGAPTGLPRGYYVPHSENLQLGDGGKRPSSGPADLSIAKPRVSEPGHLHAEHVPRQQNMGIVRPMLGAQTTVLPQETRHQHSHHHHNPSQHHHDHQQHPHQHHQDSNLSCNSDDEERQDRLQTENSDIRNRLQLLSAEVAKMKNFVLKDAIKSD